MMKKYELMYILQPTMEEEAKTALVERLNGVLTNNGAEIIESKEWGKRRFAYEIQDFKEGFYYLVTFTGEGKAIDEFSHVANMNEDVLRYMTVRLPE